MKHLLRSFTLALVVLPFACDEGDDDMDSGGDTAADDGGPADDGGSADDGADGADDAPADDGADDSSMQTCDSMHECVNDVCVCKTPGKVDEPCTNDEACATECEVCM